MPHDYYDGLSDADKTTLRLIMMTNQTCLVALDKTIAAVRRAKDSGHKAAAERCWHIAERIVRAVHEVGMTLPAHQRVGTGRAAKAQAWGEMKERLAASAIALPRRELTVYPPEGFINFIPRSFGGDDAA